MAIRLAMPNSGMGITEATVLQWLKAEGDPVSEGEAIAEIETAKAVQQLEAPESGLLVKILLPAGETAAVQTPIAIIATAGDDYSHLL